tara:strand:- start:17047 stop:17199 length:153 start_codon:yes stop_codon:yes gene_type:complete
MQQNFGPHTEQKCANLGASFLGGLVVEIACGFRVNRWVELIFPAEFKPGV